MKKKLLVICFFVLSSVVWSQVNYRFYFEVVAINKNSSFFCKIDTNTGRIYNTPIARYNMPRMVLNQTNTSFIEDGQLYEIINNYDKNRNTHNIHSEMVIEYDDFFNANPWNFDIKYSEGSMVLQNGESKVLQIPGVEGPIWTKRYFWLNKDKFIIQCKKEKTDDLFTTAVFSSDGTFIKQYESGKKELWQVGYNGNLGVLRSQVSEFGYEYQIYDFEEDKETCVLEDIKYSDVFLYPPYLILNEPFWLFTSDYFGKDISVGVIYDIMTGQVVHRFTYQDIKDQILIGFVGAEIIE